MYIYKVIKWGYSIEMILLLSLGYTVVDFYCFCISLVLILIQKPN